MTNPKILIVDDEPFNLDYLEQELEGPGYLLLTAANGQEALDMVQFSPPDLILLDIMMPVMDGFAVLAHLKSNASTRAIPVIVISAHNDLGNMVKGIQLGAEDYLPKPFEPVLLHARIAASLEKKRLHDLQQLYLRSLERELEIGRQIQQGFLPATLPDLEGWEIAAYFKAAHEVAGDFYDAFLLPDGQLVFLVGDVCDKGVGAALFMTLFRSLIRVTSTSDFFVSGGTLSALSPRERLQHVVSFTNKYVAETHGEATMFATMFVGLLNCQNGQLAYVNCGNEPPLIRSRTRGLTALRPTGPVVGVLPKAKFMVQEIVLAEDELLLAFTDGVPDARNSEGLSFGSQCLSSLLQSDLAGAGAVIEGVGKEIEQFIGRARQFDDITLLALQRKARPEVDPAV